jgi:GT2 family glycosyltransferase
VHRAAHDPLRTRITSVAPLRVDALAAHHDFGRKPEVEWISVTLSHDFPHLDECSRWARTGGGSAGIRVAPPLRSMRTHDTRPVRSIKSARPRFPEEPGLVSVVVPTYNRAAIVGQAIESALAQSYANIELIVVDDGSSDETKRVVESYGSRVRYLFQENAGVTAARNLAMHNARGEFIAFLDSDDRWQPWRIEAQIAALRRYGEAGLVWTDMAAVDRAGTPVCERYLRVMYTAHTRVSLEEKMRQVETLASLGLAVPNELAAAPVRIGDLFSEILLGNLLHTSTVLVRRAWVEQVGGFDPSFVRAGEDYEFYVRLCSVGPVMFIDAPSTLYCIGSPDQLTRPSMLLEIARNNLRAIEKWVPHAGSHLSLSREAVRARFADSYGWLGQVEFDFGNHRDAARALASSLRTSPKLDRRAGLLALCTLPSGASDWLRAMRLKTRASKGNQSAFASRVRPSADA